MGSRVYGLTLVGVIAICDQEQGGREACEKRGYPTAVLLTARGLLARARQRLLVTEEQSQEAAARLRAWRRAIKHTQTKRTTLYGGK